MTPLKQHYYVHPLLWSFHYERGVHTYSSSSSNYIWDITNPSVNCKKERPHSSIYTVEFRSRQKIKFATILFRTILKMSLCLISFSTRYDGNRHSHPGLSISRRSSLVMTLHFWRRQRKGVCIWCP